MEHGTILKLKEAVRALKEAGTAITKDVDKSLKDDDIEDIVTTLRDLRDINKIIKKSRETLVQLEERVSRQDIPDLLKQRKIKGITVEGVGRVSIGHRWSCTILTDENGAHIDKAGAYEWLRENGCGSFIIETVNAQTLGAYAHELSKDQGLRHAARALQNDGHALYQHHQNRLGRRKLKRWPKT